MIKEFNNADYRRSALIYYSNFEQVKELYEDDKEMAGELAISILEMALTGKISSDNKMIKLMLKNFEVSAENNKRKYEAKMRNTKAEQIEKYSLDRIAEMINQGKPQTEIAKELGVSRQTISRRLNEMIRIDFPELLSPTVMSNDVKRCKNNDNDNDNDNDNENENMHFLSDGYVEEREDWIDNIIENFYEMAPAIQKERLKREFGISDKKANEVLNEILAADAPKTQTL